MSDCLNCDGSGLVCCGWFYLECGCRALASVGEHAQREDSQSEAEARRAADAVPAKQADAQPPTSE